MYWAGNKYYLRTGFCEIITIKNKYCHQHHLSVTCMSSKNTTNPALDKALSRKEIKRILLVQASQVTHSFSSFVLNFGVCMCTYEGVCTCTRVFRHRRVTELLRKSEDSSECSTFPFRSFSQLSLLQFTAG